MAKPSTIFTAHRPISCSKIFWGKRVMVSGEEELDERWPSTPVITVDKLETVP
jgi:hypothetical protein